MMLSTGALLLIILTVAAITLFTRALPFAVFKNVKTPPIITYLGNVLPVAIISMLIVYCFKGVTLSVYPYGIPELIAATVVVLLHFWKRNTLVSIVSGTVVYMLLIQLVF